MSKRVQDWEAYRGNKEVVVVTPIGLGQGSKHSSVNNNKAKKEVKFQSDEGDKDHNKDKDEKESVTAHSRALAMNIMRQGTNSIELARHHGGGGDHIDHRKDSSEDTRPPLRPSMDISNVYSLHNSELGENPLHRMK